MAINDIESALCDCTLNDPATESAIADLEREADFRLPLAYRELMVRSNGLEGFVGERNYLVLWPIEQIAELNDAYGVSKFAPGLVIIGSDGGDTGYAFDTRKKGLPLVEVPFIGMSLEEAKPKGHSFVDFLNKLREE